MKYVQIVKTLVEAKDRISRLPKDSQSKPFTLLVKGIIMDDSKKEVLIQTATGREESGVIFRENPTFDHDFGHFVSEIITLRKIILDEMWSKHVE